MIDFHARTILHPRVGGQSRQESPSRGVVALLHATGNRITGVPVGACLTPPLCLLRIDDFGKRCSENTECQGDCEPIDPRVVHGQRANGRCAPTLLVPGGCPAYIEGGRVVREPCI